MGSNGHVNIKDIFPDWADREKIVQREYWPGPVALAAHRSKAEVKLAWGPLGTAKTTWLCWRAQAVAARAAKAGLSARMILIRDTYRNLIDSTFRVWLDWFPEDTAAGYISQSEPIDYKLNVGGRYHDVLFRHGQTEQDASMFLSTEYDFIGLEEVAPAYLPGQKRISPGVSEGVFDMAYPRLTRKRDWAAKVRPEMGITCNSPPLSHWTSTRIIDKSADYLQKLNWAHWMIPVSDNIVNLRPDYYDKLEMAWEGKRGLIQRFIRGERLPIFIGIPRFNLDQLDRMKQHCREPNFRGFLVPAVNNPLHVKPEKNPNGPVRMWELPASGRQYVIGGDSAEGVEGGDFSSAHVMGRGTQDIVAAFHGHIEPEAFGDELAKLGNLYNRALIGVESYPSAHGLATLTRLRNLGYPHIWYSRSTETRGRTQERIGWRSNPRTKGMMVDGIGTFLAREKGEPDPVIVDADLIGELQTYGVMENGATEAQEGCFDDRVVSFGLALLMTKVAGLEAIYPGLRRAQG